MAQPTKKAWSPVKAPVVVPVYCGSCLRFDTHATRIGADGAPSTCAKLGIGIVAKSKTCKDFKINPFVAQLRESATNGKVAKLLSELSPDALAPLAALMASEVETRASGYSFGQRVYVNVRYRGTNAEGHETDYLANYYRGEVLMVSDGMAYVSHKKVRIAIAIGAVLTQAQWVERSAYLRRENRIADRANPHSWARDDVKVLRDPKWRPPWLDAAIAAYLSRPVDDMTPMVPVKRGRGRPKGSRKATT